jgi:hypothetical protein
MFTQRIPSRLNFLAGVASLFAMLLLASYPLAVTASTVPAGTQNGDSCDHRLHELMSQDKDKVKRIR